MNIGAEVRTQFSIEEEDDLLQFAIQQSLLEAGSERDEVLFFFIFCFIIRQISYVLPVLHEKYYFM